MFKTLNLNNKKKQETHLLSRMLLYKQENQLPPIQQAFTTLLLNPSSQKPSSDTLNFNVPTKIPFSNLQANMQPIQVPNLASYPHAFRIDQRSGDEVDFLFLS